jgi:hypothetical protein
MTHSGPTQGMCTSLKNISKFALREKLKIENIKMQVKCCSEFKDIFDLKHFIEVLKDDINIVESIPSAFTRIRPLVRAPTSWSRVSELISVFPSSLI